MTQPASREYKVELEHFAGPMDLLLYLIRKEEVDIHDIPIARILEEYMKYLDILKAIDLDDAGDFLVMASTLMVIKSKMLLPIEEVDLTEELDPRYELVQQLLEYKKLKERAAHLSHRAEVSRNRVGRPDSARPDAAPPEDDKSFDEVQLWDLFQLFSKIIEETGGNVQRRHVFHGQEVPVRQFAGLLTERLASGPVSLRELWGGSGGRDRGEMIGYFLATLLLVKTQMVRIVQAEAFGDVELELNPDATDEAEQELELEDDFKD